MYRYWRKSAETLRVIAFFSSVIFWGCGGGGNHENKLVCPTGKIITDTSLIALHRGVTDCTNLNTTLPAIARERAMLCENDKSCCLADGSRSKYLISCDVIILPIGCNEAFGIADVARVLVLHKANACLHSYACNAETPSMLCDQQGDEILFFEG